MAKPVRIASIARMDTARIQLAGALRISANQLEVSNKGEGIALYLIEGKQITKLTPVLDEDALLAWIEGCTFGVHFDHEDVEILPNRNYQLSLLRK